MDANRSTLLQLLGDVQGLLHLDELRTGLLAALGRAVPSDWISINDLNPDPEQTVVLIEPEFAAEAHKLFARLAHENPLIQRYQETLDGRAYRFSDVITPERLHALALYQQFYEPIGLQHQIAFTLPHAPNHLLAIALSRRQGDYTDAERDLLNHARPYLIQAYRNAIEHTQLRAEIDRLRAKAPPTSHDLTTALTGRGLTGREAEVISWVATGRSNQSIANTLAISERTVQTHLRRAYRKLAVRTRSEAATLAWALIADEGGHIASERPTG